MLRGRKPYDYNGVEEVNSPAPPVPILDEDLYPDSETDDDVSIGSDMDSDDGQGRSKLHKSLTKFSKALSFPDGNIYRGWAIGVQRSGKQRLLAMIVLLLQISAPLAVHSWAARFLADNKRIIHTSDLINSTGILQSFMQGDNMNPALGSLWEDNKFWSEIQKKALGALFMLLIFFSNDRLLLRADVQSYKIREYFPWVMKRWGRFWLSVDVFANCWTVLLVGAALVNVFLLSEDVLNLILDSFGLLFLINVDDFGGGVEYGIDARDWDDLMEDTSNALSDQHYDAWKRRFQALNGKDEIVWLCLTCKTKPRKKDLDGVRKDIYGLCRVCHTHSLHAFEDEDGLTLLEDEQNGLPPDGTYWKAPGAGACAYTFVRLLNHAFTCFCPPLLLLYTVVECEDPLDKKLCPDNPLRAHLWNLHAWWFWIGSIMLVSLFISRVVHFYHYARPHHKTRKQLHYAGLGDSLAFLSIVIFRRPDPRVANVIWG